MKTTSLHNQSTSQNSSNSHPTQTLPDPGQTQRIVWTPPNTPPRLIVTPGGGPKPDLRARRAFLSGLSAVLLTLFILWHLPLSPAKVSSPPAPPPTPALTQQPAPAPAFEPLPAHLYHTRTASNASVRVYLIAPSVPMPPNE